MKLYIPDVLYRYLKENDPSGLSIAESKFNINGDPNFIIDDLSYGYPVATDELIKFDSDSESYFTQYINSVSLPEHLAILRDIRINPKTDEGSFLNLESRINNIESGSEKTLLRINFLKERIQHSKEPNIRDNATQYRREMISAYNDEANKHELDEETLSLIHYTTSEIFLIDNPAGNSELTIEELKLLLENLKNALEPIETVMDNSYPTKYMADLKYFEKIYAYMKFYNQYVLPGGINTLKEMDDIILDEINQIPFKYPDFSIFKIEFELDRILAHFGHSFISEGFNLIDEFHSLMVNGLNNRNLLSRSLQYRSRSDTRHFLVLLGSIIDFEKSYLNSCPWYENKNQFSNLPLTDLEKKTMAKASLVEPQFDWSVIQRKLTG